MKVGYSRPKAIRGLHPSGLKEILISRPSDLEKVDGKTQVARIAHTVGESKRVLIIDEAKKRDIRILNPGLKKAPEAEAAPTAEAPAKEATPETKEETSKAESSEEQPKGSERKSEKGTE